MVFKDLHSFLQTTSDFDRLAGDLGRERCFESIPELENLIIKVKHRHFCCF